MHEIVSTSQEKKVADYELVESQGRELTLIWLILTAVIIWGGAWWLAQQEQRSGAPQGETATQTE